MSQDEFAPLEITFRMQTPVCLTYPWIHFDALIAHLALRERNSHAYRSLPSKKVLQEVGEQSLPLKRTEGVYHASVSIFDVKDAYTTTIYKRFCEKYLKPGKMRAKKIDKGRGYFKDFMINLVYIPARKVTFYAYGDRERIEELLEGLPGLGKKVSIGFGFIKGFKVKEIDQDYSLVRDGTAMRPIPLPLLEQASEIVMMAYKPPYWAKENVAPCAPPFSKVKLRAR